MPSVLLLLQPEKPNSSYLHVLRGRMASMKSVKGLVRLHPVHTHTLPTSVLTRSGEGIGRHATNAARSISARQTAQQLPSPGASTGHQRSLSTLSTPQYGGIENDIIWSMPTYPNGNQVKFVVITDPGCQIQSELIQGILDRLGAIVSSERIDAQPGTASRTPLRVLSTARHPRGHSMIAFRVSNASFAQRDAIKASLQELSDVSYCGYEEGISSEWFR
jgi:hypothetical protein